MTTYYYGVGTSTEALARMHRGERIVVCPFCGDGTAKMQVAKCPDQDGICRDRIVPCDSCPTDIDGGNNAREK